MKKAPGSGSQGKTKSEKCVKAGMQVKIKMWQSNGYKKQKYKKYIYQCEALKIAINLENLQSIWALFKLHANALPAPSQLHQNDV